MIRIALSIFFVFVISVGGLTQSFYGSRGERTAILTGGIGTTSYFGDLNDPGDRFDAQPNIHVGLGYFVNPRIMVRGELNWFQLKGSDVDADTEAREARNLKFESNNFEVNFVGQLHLFERGSRFYQRKIVNPYIFAGIGLTYFNPTTLYEGERYNLRDYQTEGVQYSPFTLVIPYGIGIKYRASSFINLGLELGYRHAFTDYLDDVSNVYVDKSNAPAIERELAYRNPLYEPGDQRGNPDNNDGYALISIKVEYFLPVDLFGTNNKRRRR